MTDLHSLTYTIRHETDITTAHALLEKEITWRDEKIDCLLKEARRMEAAIADLKGHVESRDNRINRLLAANRDFAHRVILVATEEWR